MPQTTNNKSSFTDEVKKATYQGIKYEYVYDSWSFVIMSAVGIAIGLIWMWADFRFRKYGKIL
jgi:hypothetical protein